MKTVKPYQGIRPYVFLSYSHKDEEKIEKLLQKLQQVGCNIWYDEGIIPADEWADTIAKKLAGATMFFVIISQNSIVSQNVKREIYYAVNKNLPILSYYLDTDLHLPEGLDMQLGISQAVKNEDENFFEKIFSAFPKTTISDKTEIINSFSNIVYSFEVKDHEFLITKTDRDTLNKEVLFDHITSRAFIESFYVHSIKYSYRDEFHSFENDVLFFSILEDLDHDGGTGAPDLYVNYSFAIENPNSNDSIFHFLKCEKKRKEDPYNESECTLDMENLPLMFKNRLDS